MTDKPTTLTDWNIANAKKRQVATGRMKKLATRGKAPDLDKIAASAGEFNEATYACADCSDTGYVTDTRPGPESVYGKKHEPVTYTRRCDCKIQAVKWHQPPEHDDIPI